MLATSSMRRRAVCAFAAAAAVALAGVASDAAAAPVGAVAEFPTGLPSEQDVTGLAPGPDGAIWFAAGGGPPPGVIGRMTSAGAVSTFSSDLGSKSGPWAITTGAEGDLWFTDWGVPNAIGRSTPEGSISEFSAGLSQGSNVRADIVLGSDGNLWFGDRGSGDAIGRITPAGAITEFAINRDPEGIASGPDGDVWVAERSAGSGGLIARVTPSGQITEFTAGLNKGSEPIAIVAGTDGNLWFTDDGPTKAIGRITPSGEITEFSAGLRPDSWLERIAPGPDGSMWFTNDGEAKSVGRITRGGEITEYSAGIAQTGGPVSITPAEDGSMWVADEAVAGSPLLRIGTGAPPALASAPVVEGRAQVGVPTSCASATWSTWSGLQPSPTLFSLDGYRWLRDGSLVANGPTYKPTASDAGHKLSCRETATYPLPYLVSAVGASASIKVLPARPAIARLREKRKVWDRAIGTAFSFALNERASVAFKFRKCVAKKHRSRRCACKRTHSAGALSFTGRIGHNKLLFHGHVSRSRQLQPGRYMVRLQAQNSADMRSESKSLHFVITN
jgi:streptogramin lyase